MRTWLRIFALAATLIAGQAFAEQELAGSWQGQLAVDASTKLTIRFAFTKKPDGTYSAVLNSPDNGAIKNVAAGAVSWNAGALKVDVPSLSGSYAGTLKDGKFDGKWTQQGQVLALALTPYVPAQMSKADIDTLTGTWVGPLKTPAMTLTFVYRFKVDPKGVLTGVINVPEQGGNELPMSEIEFTNNKLAFKVPMVFGEFTATQANGVLTGAWKQGGNPPNGLPVVLKKGEYAAQTYALPLDTDAFAALNGKWTGTVGPVNVVLRFSMIKSGQIVGYLDSADGRLKDVPVTEASFTAGKLDMKVSTGLAQYTGDLKGKTITGQWKQGPQSIPVTFTRQ